MAPAVARVINHHDESPLFFIAYVTLSVILSLFFNLGFFVILIFAHFLLDFLKHWHSYNKKTNHIHFALYFAWRDAFLFDSLLLVVAFAFGYLLQFTFAAPLAGTANTVRLLEVEDVVRILPRFVFADTALKHIATIARYMKNPDKRKIFMPAHMKRTEVFYLSGIFLFLVLILLLPLITGQGTQSLAVYASHELIPQLRLP